MSEQFFASIVKSKEQARRIYAEERGLHPSKVGVIMGDYDPETGMLDWFCWELGTWVYQDENGNEQRR